MQWWVSREAGGRDRGGGGYLELRPRHSHVNTVVVGPPLQVLLVVGVVYCVVEFFVYLW